MSESRVPRQMANDNLTSYVARLKSQTAKHPISNVLHLPCNLPEANLGRVHDGIANRGIGLGERGSSV